MGKSIPGPCGGNTSNCSQLLSLVSLSFVYYFTLPLFCSSFPHLFFFVHSGPCFSPLLSLPLSPLLTSPPPKGDNTSHRLSVRVILFFFSYLCNMRSALISIQQPQHGVMTMFPIRNNTHSLVLSGIYGATR